MTEVAFTRAEARLEYRAIAELAPYIRNARTHSDNQISQIARSIEEFGWTNPVLVDGENGIIAGHGRVLAAERLGIETVPVIELGHFTPEQKRAYILADNKLGENAGWDEGLLGMELSELNEFGVDISVIGFSEDELAGYLNTELPQGLVADDEVPTTSEQPVSRSGDTWLLGSHRLVCGDATHADTYSRLMDGDKASLIFTDPPYGMAYGGGRAAGTTPHGARVKAHGMILNDELVGDRLVGLVRDALSHALGVSASDAAAYVCATLRTYREFVMAMVEAGYETKGCIVWDKGSIGLGNAHYRPQHEFLLYRPGRWFGGKGESDVWRLSRDASTSYKHPTQKPVELIMHALENSSRPGDIVLDCFGGSGSTLVACEKSARHARLIELDPRYCDVIISRWQDWTGKQAVSEDGRVFDDLAGNGKNPDG